MYEVKEISLIRIGNIRKHAKDENIVRLELECGTPSCHSTDFYEVNDNQQIRALSQVTRDTVKQKLYLCTNCRALHFKTIEDVPEEKEV